MFYVFLLICGALGIVLYLVVMMNLVPGAAAERIGVLEALPDDVGKWKEDTESEAGKAAASEGLVRELRHYFYETNGQLVLQARYRNQQTNEVVRTEPEEVVKRRRVRT